MDARKYGQDPIFELRGNTCQSRECSSSDVKRRHKAPPARTYNASDKMCINSSRI